MFESGCDVAASRRRSRRGAFTRAATIVEPKDKQRGLRPTQMRGGLERKSLSRASSEDARSGSRGLH
eukprot:7439396-Pyramimonas_sp.AAC.1